MITIAPLDGSNKGREVRSLYYWVKYCRKENARNSRGRTVLRIVMFLRYLRMKYFVLKLLMCVHGGQHECLLKSMSRRAFLLYRI